MPSNGRGASQSEDYLRIERQDGVAIVTLDHQSDRNALSLGMTNALVETFRALSSDQTVGAIVIAAAGPVFSSGGSVDDLLTPKVPLRETYAGVVAVAECGLPTVAAVNGPALGAGMNLAMACDLIICSSLARFETRFPQIDLHPGGGHLWHLRQRLGRQGAAALSIFGEALSGEESERRGLAWRCVPETDLLSVVVDYAARAARLDRPLVERVLATLDESAALHLAADAVRLELPAQQWSMGRPEFAAALQRLRTQIGRNP
jgi:enoyl-CoA hydratase